MSKNAVATKADNALPAHLQGGKTAKFGQIDQSDIIIPRVKLLQSTSPELETFDEAKVGQFWHTITEQALGKELRIIPISLKKELVLWAPRGDDRGILARSSDCRNWDEGFANLEFTVNIKNVGNVTYYTKENVAASGLAEFGSLIPNDPKSRPAASLTYRMMFLFPDHLDLGPAIIINTRSSLRPAKGLISKIELRPVEHYGQVYTMYTTDEAGDEGPYKNYGYRSDGYATEEEYELAKSTFEKFDSLDWRASEETDEQSTESSGRSSGAGAASDKF